MYSSVINSDSMYILLGFVLFCSLGRSLCQSEGESCSDSKGQGVCRYLMKCPSSIKAIQSGSFPKVCGYNGTQVLICCLERRLESLSTSRSTSTNAYTTTISTIRGSVANHRKPGDISAAKCEEYSKFAYVDKKIPTLLNEERIHKFLDCPHQYQSLIVAGKYAAPREFPHMAQVGFVDDTSVYWDCAGSIISESFILTAGHCLDTRAFGPPKLVRVGITNQSDTIHMQQRNISEIFKHPDYSFTKYHDIGLLKLDKKIDLNNHARPACLYTQRNLYFDKAIVTGWEKVEFAGEPSRDMIKVILEHVDVVKCNNTYRREINYKHSVLQDGILDDYMICYGTRSEFIDACQGDSGGPLQYYMPDTTERKCMYWILGVTSFGKFCGAAVNLPGVYTRVSAYVKWIEDTVWPN